MIPTYLTYLNLPYNYLTYYNSMARHHNTIIHTNTPTPHYTTRHHTTLQIHYDTLHYPPALLTHFPSLPDSSIPRFIHQPFLLLVLPLLLPPASSGLNLLPTVHNINRLHVYYISHILHYLCAALPSSPLLPITPFSPPPPLPPPSSLPRLSSDIPSLCHLSPITPDWLFHIPLSDRRISKYLFLSLSPRDTFYAQLGQKVISSVDIRCRWLPLPDPL